MERKNMTVEDLRYRIYQHWQGCEDCSLEEMNGADLIAIADQFVAAHRREMDTRAIMAGVYLADAVNDAHKREFAKLRECLLLSSNAMEMVVQWLGKYPAWQDELKRLVAKNRKAVEGGF